MEPGIGKDIGTITGPGSRSTWVTIKKELMIRRCVICFVDGGDETRWVRCVRFSQNSRSSDLLDWKIFSKATP